MWRMNPPYQSIDGARSPLTPVDAICAVILRLYSHAAPNHHQMALGAFTGQPGIQFPCPGFLV